MDYQKIQALVELMGSSDLEALIYREGEVSLTLNRFATPSVKASQPLDSDLPAHQEVMPSAHHEPTAPPVASSVPASSVDIQSPLYGVVYLSPTQEEAPYVCVGDSVIEGQTLCLLEAMKMYHPITAQASGCVREVCVQSGDEVASGQRLFLLD